MLSPTNGEMKNDSYLDANFAVLYRHDKPTDPTSTNSRTEFVITALRINKIYEVVAKLVAAVSEEHYCSLDYCPLWIAH